MASPDELLDAFVVAWRAGDAPDAGEWIDRADPADQDEVADLIGGFLLVADDVEPNPTRRAQLEADPAVARLVAIADVAPHEPTPAEEPAWGTRLRALRERAGLELGALAERFAASFGLAAPSADRARRYLADLEDGALDARGVSSRASFRLEELLDAGAGSLTPPSTLQFRAMRRPAPESPSAPESLMAPAAAPRSRPGDVPPADPEALHDLEDEDDVADLLRFAADALARPADHEWDELDELLRGG